MYAWAALPGMHAWPALPGMRFAIQATMRLNNRAAMCQIVHHNSLSVTALLAKALGSGCKDQPAHTTVAAHNDRGLDCRGHTSELMYLFKYENGIAAIAGARPAAVADDHT